MKKLKLTLLVLVAATTTAFAQAPARFNYQGIARSATGAPLANKSLNLRITIHDGSGTGTIVYQETQSTATNAYGLYNLSIGGGNVITGTLASVNWNNGSKYIQVELDPSGGTAYTNLGASQLLSVPYAMHSASAASVPLTLAGNVLSAGGNNITLPAAPTYTAGAGVSISGSNQISVNSLSGDVTGATNTTTVTKIQGTSVSTTTPSSGQVLKYNGTAWVPATDNDAQTLSVSGNSLSISGGNSVTLPAGSTYTAGTGLTINSSNVISVNNLAGDVTGAPNATTVARIQGIAVSSSAPSSGQTLVYNGSSWIFGTPSSTVSLSGTTNYVTKFTSASTVGNSLIQDDGTSVSIGTSPSSSDKLLVSSSGSAIRGTTSGSGNALAGSVSGTGTGNAGYFDGGSAGKGIVVPNGPSVFGNVPGSGMHRISVVQSGSGSGMDSNAAIYGYVNSTKSALKGGVYGTYDTTMFGVGVQGLGWHGYTFRSVGAAFSNINPAVNDIGVYGSANSAGVMGTSGVGYGIAGYSNGSSTTSAGVYGYAGSASGGIGVSGNSSNGIGVYGTASTSYGLGVYGTVASTNATAVYGVASGSGGNGVYGYASSTSGGYGIYGAALSTTSGYAGYFAGRTTVTGSLSVSGTLSKGGGSFKIDDPIDPENKYLYHSFVESPDMMNIYNGNIVTDAQGYASIRLPKYFEALNKDFRYQLTVIGTFAQAIVKEKIKGNVFVIQTNQPNVEVSWQVTGVRQDAFANAHRIPEEIEKEPEFKGLYLHPKELNKPESMGIDYKMQQEHHTPPDVRIENVVRRR